MNHHNIIEKRKNWTLESYRSVTWKNIHTLNWINQYVNKNFDILDTGCGVGLNVIWLAEHGFQSIQGFDIDPSAIAAGQELTSKYEGIRLFVDDGLIPQCIQHKNSIDLVLCIGWSFLLIDFNLNNFLANFSTMLKDRYDGGGGVI
jgi:2-polyprenyl-3-methyl-5-hydroxy-6-metoxy-1,4-benzoquinol methylase